MNDSPKPSAPAGNHSAAVEVEIPVDIFFDARDYAPDAKVGAKPKKDQQNVSLARSRRVTAAHQKLEQVAIALKHLRTADAVGLVTQSMDVLVGITDQFHKQIHDLAKAGDNAELRYEEFFLTPPPVPPAADVPPASAAGAASITVTMDDGGSALVGFEPTSVVPAHPWLTEQATIAMRRKAALAAQEVQR